MYRHEPDGDICWWCGESECTETCPAPPFSPTIALVEASQLKDLPGDRIGDSTLGNSKSSLEVEYGDRLDVRQWPEKANR